MVKQQSFLSQLLVLFYDASVYHEQFQVLHFHLHYSHPFILLCFFFQNSSSPVSLHNFVVREREREIDRREKERESLQGKNLLSRRTLRLCLFDSLGCRKLEDKGLHGIDEVLVNILFFSLKLRFLT